MRARSALVAFAFLVPLLWQSAQLPAQAATIQACVNHNNGQIRIVGAGTQCKRNERLVSWDKTGPPGPAGSSLVVKDANDAVVGTAIDAQTAIVHLGDTPAVIKVDTTGFTQNGPTLVTESADCGTPLFMQTPSPALLPTATTAGHVAYVPSGTSTELNIQGNLFTYMSDAQCIANGPRFFLTPKGCCAAAFIIGPGVQSVVSARPFDLSTLGFSPPFHIEVP